MSIKCPKCGSESTEEYDLDYEYDEKLGKHVIHRSMTCNDCKQEFTVFYVHDETMDELHGKAEPNWEERTS